MWKQWHISSSWALKSLRMVTAAVKLEDDCFLAGKWWHFSANKGPYSQGYGLPHGHVELWELNRKEGGAWRIDAFELWCWRRLLRVLWTARRSNQSSKPTLNTHWKDWCWSWSSSISVIWCEQKTHWKSLWCWGRLRAEGEEGIIGWDGWTASQM